MKMNKGKKILKSKTPNFIANYVVLMVGGGFVVPTVIFWIIDALNPPYLFTFDFFEFFLLFMGLFCFIFGVEIFLSYVIVYENGVKVRKPLELAEFFSYIIPKFILYEQIDKVSIEQVKLRKRSKDKVLSIQVKGDVYSIETSWILNYKDIERELTSRVSSSKIKQKPIEKPKGITSVTFIKQNREYHSRSSVPLKWTFPEGGKFQIDCRGSGTLQNPIIIDNSLNLPNRVSIKDYNLHFNFKNLQLTKLYVENCKDFTFSNCEIDRIRMSSCSNINFTECSIPRELKLKECKNFNFKTCLIRKATVFKSNDIGLKDCLIIRLTDWMSKNNIFESNKIKELRTNVKRESYNKRTSLIKNEIKKEKYRLKELFPMGGKVLIRDKYFLISMAFVVIFAIGLFLVIDSISKGYDVGPWGDIFPYIHYIFILLLIIMAAIDEYYYKFKFKSMTRS